MPRASHPSTYRNPIVICRSRRQKPFQRQAFTTQATHQEASKGHRRQPQQRPNRHGNLCPQGSQLHLQPNSHRKGHHLKKHRHRHQRQQHTRFRRPQAPNTRRHSLPIKARTQLISLPQGLQSILPQRVTRHQYRTNIRPTNRQHQQQDLSSTTRRQQVQRLQASQVQQPNSSRTQQSLQRQARQGTHPFNQQQQNMQRFLKYLHTLRHQDPTKRRPTSTSPTSTKQVTISPQPSRRPSRSRTRRHLLSRSLQRKERRPTFPLPTTRHHQEAKAQLILQRRITRFSKALLHRMWNQQLATTRASGQKLLSGTTPICFQSKHSTQGQRSPNSLLSALMVFTHTNICTSLITHISRRQRTSHYTNVSHNKFRQINQYNVTLSTQLNMNRLRIRSQKGLNQGRNLLLNIRRRLSSLTINRRIMINSRILISVSLLRNLHIRRINTRVVLMNRLVKATFSTCKFSLQSYKRNIIRCTTQFRILRFNTRRDETFPQLRILRVRSLRNLTVRFSTRASLSIDYDYRGMFYLSIFQNHGIAGGVHGFLFTPFVILHVSTRRHRNTINSHTTRNLSILHPNMGQETYKRGRNPNFNRHHRITRISRQRKHLTRRRRRPPALLRRRINNPLSRTLHHANHRTPRNTSHQKRSSRHIMTYQTTHQQHRRVIITRRPSAPILQRRSALIHRRITNANTTCRHSLQRFKQTRRPFRYRPNMGATTNNNCNSSSLRIEVQ